MALFLFTKAILEGRPIDVFNHGRMRRDFTYIDDIVEGVVRVLDRVADARSGLDRRRARPGARASAPYRIYNIGNNQPVELLHFIAMLEKALGHGGQGAAADAAGRRAGHLRRRRRSRARDTGFAPTTPIEVGVARFVRWYRDEWLPIAE